MSECVERPLKRRTGDGPIATQLSSIGWDAAGLMVQFLDEEGRRALAATNKTWRAAVWRARSRLTIGLTREGWAALVDREAVAWLIPRLRTLQRLRVKIRDRPPSGETVRALRDVFVGVRYMDCAYGDLTAKQSWMGEDLFKHTLFPQLRTLKLYDIPSHREGLFSGLRELTCCDVGDGSWLTEQGSQLTRLSLGSFYVFEGPRAGADLPFVSLSDYVFRLKLDVNRALPQTMTAVRVLHTNEWPLLAPLTRLTDLKVELLAGPPPQGLWLPTVTRLVAGYSVGYTRVAETMPNLRFLEINANWSLAGFHHLREVVLRSTPTLEGLHELPADCPVERIQVDDDVHVKEEDRALWQRFGNRVTFRYGAPVAWRAFQTEE